jgi:peroxiredoxin
MNTETKLPSYSEGLKELRANLKSMLPAKALAVFDEDADALQESYHNILKLHVGDVAPDFTLSNAIGETVRLSTLLSEGKVVLTFYRGDWCPYCNLQLNQYQKALPEIRRAGAQLVAVSPQTPDASLSVKEKNNLEFEVLSDNGNLVAGKYTTLFKNGDAPVNTMTELGFEFDAHYADDTRELPVPAVFIIEQDGIISFARALGGDYRQRVEVSTILESLGRA